ncbi:MAG: hypothetical protein FJ276_25710, partial [Planctomycetes bacterium]|nr:hypothetical protein [Planctomycetota bacterium]
VLVVCVGLWLAIPLPQEAKAQVPIRIARPIAPQSFVGDYPTGTGVRVFDMGTPDSPVSQGCQRVLPTDEHSKVRGFGFETVPDEREHITDDIVSQSEPTPVPRPVRAAIYGVDDLTCDCVAGKKLAFRVDVPPGRYDVVAVLGHMFPACHVFARVNGQEVLSDTDIFTCHHDRRGHRDDGACGVWVGDKNMAHGDTVIVRADPQNTVGEINEQNNTAERVIQLTSKQVAALNEAKAAPDTGPTSVRGREAERGRPPAEAAPRNRSGRGGDRPEARRGQDARTGGGSSSAPAERPKTRRGDSPAATTSGRDDAARRAELAKWDAADAHRSQTGPGGTEWDRQYRSFIQTSENAVSKGFPTHADAARQIKEDAAQSGEALAKHLGWVLFIKHFSQAYRPEEATADLKRLYEDLVDMKLEGGSRPERLPFDGDPRLVIHRDVVYGKTHPEIQKLDAYLVQSAQPTPVVIEIHGGGWRRGSKSQFVYQGNLIGEILDAGISVVAIDYRLTPQHTMPAQLEDAVRAVQFVRSMAKSWNIDPDRMAGVGGSAGAHLAAWVALHDDFAMAGSADPVERCSSRLACFVPLSGPMDLTRVRPTELASQPLRGQDFANAYTAAFGCTAEQYERDAQVRQRIHDASPLFLVSGDDPPAFVMGTWNDPRAVLRDPPVPAVINDPHSIWHGVLLAEALRKAGVSVALRVGPYVGKDPAADNAALVGFLRQQFVPQ